MSHVTPPVLDALCRIAVSKYLEDCGRPPQRIFGIPRGGMSVAYRIAHEFERRKPEAPTIVVDRAPAASELLIPIGEYKPLIVDDIADTGRTIRPYHERNFLTMALLVRDGARDAIDYYGEHQEGQHAYVDFPWDEKDLEPTDAVVRLLEWLGLDPNDPSLAETPRRFLGWLGEFRLDQPAPDITTFGGIQYDQMILVRDIPFVSLCEHHLLPFFGKASVAYIPAEGELSEVIGLSKLARIVQHEARRPQVQERMTDAILGHVSGVFVTRGVGVIVRAEHTCMSWRGPRVEGATTVTSSLSGDFRDDLRTREEFLKLATM